MVEKDTLNVKRNDLFRYSFYDNCHNEVAVLNIDNIKKILQVDEVILEEEYV